MQSHLLLKPTKKLLSKSTNCNDMIKFFGFWPLPPNYFVPEALTLTDENFLDDETRTQLFEWMFDVSGEGWRFAVTGDYLCLLHLEEPEEDLRKEREANENADIVKITLGVSHQTRFHYCECLNAFFFLMFCSCFTGRGHYSLHDFSELTIWSCGRFTYNDEGKAIRGGQFLRPPEQQLRRLKVATVENSKDRLPFDLEILKDAAFYWSVIFSLGLCPTAAVGAKVVSEHRLENFRASVSLAWFEVEGWIVEHAKDVGIDIYRRDNNRNLVSDEAGEPSYKPIKRIINNFPEGTWVYANRQSIHKLRILRNRIAHKNYTPSQSESASSIELFVTVLNFRSGLNLKADTHRVPTQGVS